jgi:hypothetical protein
MAKFAPVGPVHLLARLKRENREAFGDYHLPLAHDVLNHPKAYSELFIENTQTRVTKEKPYFIILDNSVIELGKPMDEKDLFEAAEIVRPDVLVLPDVIGDIAATLDLARDACNRWQNSGINCGYMAVPQGKIMSEVMECIDEMLTFPGVTHWGVPRDFVKYSMRSRRGVIEYLNRVSQKPIHLLGFSDKMDDDVRCSQMPNVIGIDSAVPLRLGQKNIVLDMDLKTGPRGTFWEDPVDKIEPETYYNLNLVRNWVR